jgi:localization factor PodJL
MKLWRSALPLLFCALMPLSGYAGLDDIRRDAEKGDIAAQYEMGILYEFGFKLADREVEALAWYTVAAERGNKQAAGRRDLLKARLSTDQRSKAEARSREIMASQPAVAPAPAEPEAPAVAPAEPAAPEAAPQPAADEPADKPGEKPAAAPAQEPAPKP